MIFEEGKNDSSPIRVCRSNSDVNESVEERSWRDALPEYDEKAEKLKQDHWRMQLMIQQRDVTYFHDVMFDFDTGREIQ